MASTLIDYRGRTADMVALHTTRPNVSTPELFEAQQLVLPGSSGGALIAGVHKLAQKELIVLTTPLGSKQYLPKSGTRFLLDARSGMWRTVADVIQSFVAARVEVAKQIQEQELASDPADERYGNFLLTEVQLDQGDVFIRLTITSMAGTQVTVLTPISVPLK